MMLVAASVAAAPQQHAEPSCPAERILVAYEPAPMVPQFGWSAAAQDQALLVSKILERGSDTPKHDILPKAESPSRGPSVLTPACKPTDERKRKDHPMA